MFNFEDLQCGEEADFRHFWRSLKQRILKNLQDLPEEAEIVLDAACSSVIYIIKKTPDISDAIKLEWINIILEDRKKDNLLDNWWN